MRYLLSGRLPEASSILLVESGSRGILEKVVAGLRRSWGADVPIDLVSCFANLPLGLDARATRVFRVSDYRGRQGARATLPRTARAELPDDGHRLLRRAAHDEVEMGARAARAGQDFHHQ